MSPHSLRVEPAPGAPALPEPPPHDLRPLAGPDVVTGGGLAARLSAERGLLGAWRGVEALEPSTGLPWPAGGHGRIGPGCWIRSIEGGGEERGLLLDPFPVIVVQRTDGAGTGDPVTHLLVPPDVPVETCRRLVPQLAAHALRRHGRGAEDAGFAISLGHGNGRISEALAAGLAVLDEAPLLDLTDPGTAALAPGRGARQPPDLIAGMGTGALLFVEPSHRVEIALGALAAGRWGLARALVEASLSDADIPGAARLLLATRWAVWTGAVERLRPHLGSLDDAARRFTSGHRDPGGSDPAAPDPDALGVAGLPAAFPSARALIAGLADAVEPLGHRGWTDELRALALALEPARPSAGEPAPRGLRLPVLGQGGRGPAPSAGPRPDPPDLPPVQAFASPHHPSVATRRTLHAARLVRTAVERLLGARPDASYGRITLAPDLVAVAEALLAPASPGAHGAPRASGPTHLVVRGLRLADARLDLDCRVEGGLGTLRVSQVGGRVPVNVVFEPRLPLAGVRSVRLGTDPADVEIEELDDGVRLRFQFPLDPERRVIVDGTA
jgi:hypothetical protein